MLKKLRLGVWLAGSLVFSTTLAADLTGLKVENPHTLQPPPGASVAAGYMLLKNHSDVDIVITGARSDAFDRVEIHRSVIDNDVARMIKQETLVVPAAGEIELTHGGYHLMLMGIRQPLQVGDEIPITITSTTGELGLTLSVVEFGQHHRSMSSSGAESTRKSAPEDHSHSHGHSGH